MLLAIYLCKDISCVSSFLTYVNTFTKHYTLHVPIRCGPQMQFLQLLPSITIFSVCDHRHSQNLAINCLVVCQFALCVCSRSLCWGKNHNKCELISSSYKRCCVQVSSSYETELGAVSQNISYNRTVW